MEKCMNGKLTNYDSTIFNLSFVNEKTNSKKIELIDRLNKYLFHNVNATTLLSHLN